MSEIQGIAPPDTLPEKAIPLPTPSPPALPSPKVLRSWLPLYLHKTDRVVDHLSKTISTPSGTDIFLLTLCYGSLLSSTVLSSISLHRIHRTARQIIDKAISLPANTTVIIDTSTIPSSRLLIASSRLKALSNLISDFRIFVRLWGLLGIWKWGKSALDDPSEDALVRRITYAQVAVNVFYQYLENGAYLASKGVVGWSAEKQMKAWVWSSRFWAAHVGLDFLRLYHEWAVRKSKGKSTLGEKRSEAEVEWRAKWRREMVTNLAYAPLTVHWSLEDGLVSDFWVGLLGSVVGVTGLRELWKNTRKAEQTG